MLELSTSPTSATITVGGDLDIADRDRFPEVTARLRGLRRRLVVVDLCSTTSTPPVPRSWASVAVATGRRGGVTVLRGAGPRELFVLDVCGALPLFRTDRAHRCPPATQGEATAPRGDPTALVEAGPETAGPRVAHAGRATLLPGPEGGQPSTGG